MTKSFKKSRMPICMMRGNHTHTSQHYSNKTNNHCATEECCRGQGPSSWTCLTSTAHCSGADGPSPCNPTTTGSNRDSSGSSGSLKNRNSLQRGTPIKSLCSPASATSQVLISAPVWGFKRNQISRGCSLLMLSAGGVKGKLEWERADLLHCTKFWLSLLK